jgi:hypothetical protein
MNTLLQKLTLSLATLLTLTTASASDEWSHKNLHGDAGLQISLDYKVSKFWGGCYKACPTIYYAGPLWANLRYQNISSQDQVQMVLINYSKSPHVNYFLPENQQTIDLKFDVNEKKFTGELKSIEIHLSGYGGTSEFQQEVAVVINGKWYKDPSTNSNFRFSLK